MLRFTGEEAEVVCRVACVPCGLGFLPDGDLVILEMRERKLWRWSAEALTLYADLSGIAAGTIDDMIIDASGRAYVGDLGFDYSRGRSRHMPAGACC